MYQLYKELLSQKKFYYFLVLSIFLVGLSFAIQFSFYNETIFYNTYAEQLTMERTQKMYETGKQWQWISYLLIPIVLFVKVLYNTFWVTTGSLLNDDRIRVKDNYNICLKTEFVFVLMLLVKFIWLLFFKPVNNLNDLGFVPGSLINFCDVDKIPKWLIYPLQTINIWEVLFCIAGTSMYSIHYDVSKAKALQSFCIPYLTGLFIWVLVIVFITLQFT